MNRQSYVLSVGHSFSGSEGKSCRLISSHMDKSAFWSEIALTTVQLALGFASCDFPILCNFFPNCTAFWEHTFLASTLIHVIIYNHAISNETEISKKNCMIPMCTVLADSHTIIA